MKELSKTEELIMRAIYDLVDDSPQRGVQVTKLLEHLGTKYNKPYKRTTLVTFLQRMGAKEVVYVYRKGRFSYAVPLHSLEEFRKQRAKQVIATWYNGDVDLMVKETK